MSVPGGTFRYMTVIDPADVDWTTLGELSVISAARCGIGQAIDEGLRRGLWFEGEEPPDPLAGWFPPGKAVFDGRVELRSGEPACSCRRVPRHWVASVRRP
jgi:hypothetical protein